MSEDKMMLTLIVAEFVQFATKSRSKMLKRWIWIGLLLKKKIKYKQQLPSASSSPSYAIGGSNKYSFERRSPQNMMDILQSALKKGIADPDKATQSEAMN